MRRRTWILGLVTAATLLGCDKDAPPSHSPTGKAAAPQPEPAPKLTDESASASSPAAESAAAGSEALATETPEEDPGSQTVKLKLDVAPRSARAVVWWGRQKLGEAPLAIERPRRSGPMNVVVKADGYLDHHTRLFTDRDDRLSVSLVRPADAVGLLGYRRKPGMGLPLPGDGGGSALPSAARDAGMPLEMTLPQDTTF